MKDDGSACLTGFGLMSIIPDPDSGITASNWGVPKRMDRWMAPEFFSPTDFRLWKFQPTRESDCYAFGMVIYEVSG